jgi:hypothetical protein
MALHKREKRGFHEVRVPIDSIAAKDIPEQAENRNCKTIAHGSD